MRTRLDDMTINTFDGHIDDANIMLIRVTMVMMMKMMIELIVP